MKNLSPAAALHAVATIRNAFAARLAASIDAPPIAEELEKALALLAEVDFTRASEEHLRASAHPVIQQLRQSELGSVDPATQAIFQAFLPWLDALPWRYSYAPRPDAPDIGNRMAWAELVGPIAPFSSRKVCLGLTALGPRLLYPLHTHPAVESYLVISGTSAWTAAGQTRKCPPGTLILHPSNIVHAMETDDEPLLAAYAWTGDVETLSAYV
jgi:hypothetical protein